MTRKSDLKMILSAAAMAAGLILLTLTVAASQTLESSGTEAAAAAEEQAAEDTILTSIPIKDLPAASLTAIDAINAYERAVQADSALLAIADLVPPMATRVDSLCLIGQELVASKPTLGRVKSRGFKPNDESAYWEE